MSKDTDRTAQSTIAIGKTLCGPPNVPAHLLSGWQNVRPGVSDRGGAGILGPLLTYSETALKTSLLVPSPRPPPQPALLHSALTVCGGLY
jgi:hypothetical protein